jgi:glycerol uptake facilitator-like aquaporin
MHSSYLAIIVAVLLAFFASFVWYMLFGKQLAKLNPKVYGNMQRPEPRKMILEFVRNFVLALVIFYLSSNLHIMSMSGALVLALILWIGFPLILLTGSVLHEKVPAKLAAIHCGDWLIKLLIMVVIISLWH